MSRYVAYVVLAFVLGLLLGFLWSVHPAWLWSFVY